MIINIIDIILEKKIELGQNSLKINLITSV